MGSAGMETILANDRTPGELRVARYHGILSIRAQRDNDEWFQLMVDRNGVICEARGSQATEARDKAYDMVEARRGVRFPRSG